MPKICDFEKPYFQHDFFAMSDKKIRKLIFELGYEGYGIFWAVVEFMHREELKVGEEYLVGCPDTDKVVKILNDFDLFKVENGYYVSDRIIRNLEKIEIKKNEKQKAAQSRWAISAYCKAYKDVFGVELTLSAREKKKVIELSSTVSDFNDRLSDVFYTAKKIPPFDSGVIANSSWLLNKDNFFDVLNGKYGAVKHKPTEEEQKAKQEKEMYVSDTDAIRTKDEAVEFIHAQNLSVRNPAVKNLMSKFGITKDEVEYG